MPGARSSIAILGVFFSVSNFCLAHSPMRRPAFLLSVAKRASTALCGSVGVSSAMTMTPAARDFRTAGTIAFGVRGRDQDALRAARRHVLDRCDLTLVVRVGLARRGQQLDVVRLRRLLRGSFIFTKNGFVSRFVIRPTVTPLLARAVVAAAVAATGGDAECHPRSSHCRE